MRRTIIICILVQLLCCHTHGQTMPPQAVATRILKDSLFIPWEILYGPDDHIWFTQKNGFICRMDTGGHHVDTLYQEPKTVTIKESGMLGMVLHPDFVNNPYVYVAWEYMDAPYFIHDRIWRYTYSSATNTLSSPKIILDSLHGFIFHNGCRLAIADDKMFISVGDAEDMNSPQNLDSINGKILRINLDGSVPADNPIPGNPVWTWGHRNPQGLVYANGILYSSEHGTNSDDELNIISKGHNYGWPVVEGYCDKPAEMQFCKDSNVTEPLHAFTPTVAPCGIDFYHHLMFPWLENSILMCTLKDQYLYQLQLNDTHDAITNVSVVTGINYGRLRDICISPDGKIFLSTSNSVPNDTAGTIDRIIEVYNPEYNPATAGSMILYPNPTATYLYVVVPGSYKQLHFMLSSTDGKKISEGTLPSGRPRIYVGELPQALYRLTIQPDDGPHYTGTFLRGK